MKVQLSHNNFFEHTVEIEITGSKSESNRLLILQALYPNLKIKNLSESDDTKVLTSGIQLTEGEVDVHHAGTAMRFLTAYFATTPGTHITLTGSARMQERPVKLLVESLRKLGCVIEYEKEAGFPPLRIKGSIPSISEVDISANVSSQYISALMLVAPRLPHGLTIRLKGKVTSIPYIEMTLSLLKQIGILGTFSGQEISIPPVRKIDDRTVVVESDWSSASYFYSLVALSSNLSVKIKSYRKDSLQGDSALVSIYEQLGVHSEFIEAEQALLLTKTNSELSETIVLDLANTPDIAQTIAVTCFGNGISCKLSGLHTLKIKETDRLVALKNELSKLGAEVEITENSLYLKSGNHINPNVEIATYNDHRMAMAFAPLALKVPIRILDAEVVSKSYPRYWEDLKTIGLVVISE
ncbi:MAG: 3-phosphoshikimate 1-carboxyvinyltransferase [Flavobacteriaceae bacterium]|nr:3-phosphoshikimate 1-carboxyvinyltransferase [Flavobacteriaceae bacterium]